MNIYQIFKEKKIILSILLDHDKTGKGEELKFQFDAARKDIEHLDSGVKFALDKLKDYPSVKPKKKSPFAAIRKIESVCKAGITFQENLNPKTLWENYKIIHKNDDN